MVSFNTNLGGVITQNDKEVYIAFAISKNDIKVQLSFLQTMKGMQPGL